MSDKNAEALNISEAKYFVLKYLIIFKYFKNSKGESYKKTHSFITTNQIRKFLSAFIRISNKIKNAQLSLNSYLDDEDESKELNNSNEEKSSDIINDIIKEIEYMNIQLVYLVGRNKQDNSKVNIRPNKDADSEDAENNRLHEKDINEHINPNSPFAIRIGNKKGIEALYMRIQKNIENIIDNKEKNFDELFKNFDELYKYIESIVAYHKFYEVEGE
ncbi:type III-A CRISPR-associated protein Csm2 [Brachyspira alvinipulli]|uniref:type III-A CRISPR-associated protein Csm2 n=1 Tax=Brachyspira alvinipulli TaxID=84379 RepID=UPI000483821F|nr:type III-A CRISPR-associated protein Csm2 [Brachyspira alvinipulli]